MFNNWIKRSSLGILFSFSLISTVQSAGAEQAVDVDREKLWSEIKAQYNDIKSKEAELIAPSTQDLKLASVDPNQRGMGIVRLLPREMYDGSISVSGGGAYYSFARLVHEYGYGSDIELSNGQFGVGFAGCDFGFFVDTGETKLENVTKDHRSAEALMNFQVAKTEPEIRKQQSIRNFQKNGYLYTERLGVEIGHVYLLRSVNFDTSDVLVAIKPIRKDDFDKSIVIEWKLLNEFPTPSCR